MNVITKLVREKLRRESGSVRCSSTAGQRFKRDEGHPAPRLLQERVVLQSGSSRNITSPSNTNSNVSSNKGESDGDGLTKTTMRPCWLCAQPGNYHLEENFVLCFSCIRLVIREFVLPRVCTRERRERDTAFIAKIRRMLETEEKQLAALSVTETKMPSNGRPHSTTGRDTVAVLAPSQAKFVMSSHIRTRRGYSRGDSSSPNARGVMPDNTFWTCPECTFLNTGDNSACEACLCRRVTEVVCPFCNDISRSGAERVSTCPVKNALHIVWNCRRCKQVNTVDCDVCYYCRSPLVWTCRNCTVEQESISTLEGLRICKTCTAYCTPLEVFYSRLAVGQESDATARLHSNVEFGINDAETIAEQERQITIEEAKTRLTRRLKQLDVSHMNEQQPDGNCLFRALATQLFGCPESHMVVRRLVVDYMRERPESYGVLFDGEGEWQEYLQNMQQGGVWGDELCLNATTRCFHVDIHVITSDERRWYLVFQHDELGASSSVIDIQEGLPTQTAQGERALPRLSSSSSNSITLFLVYMAPVHYNDVMTVCTPKINDLRKCLVKKLLATMEEESSWHDVSDKIKGGHPPPSRQQQQQQQQQDQVEQRRAEEVPSTTGVEELWRSRGVKQTLPTYRPPPRTQRSPLNPPVYNGKRASGRGPLQ